MTQEINLQEVQAKWHGTLKSYVIGFASSILLTTISFSLVFSRFFSDQHLIYAVISLALVQCICQLKFFFHIERGPKPRWELLVFCFMVVVLLIISIGSLVIMNDLNDRMMPKMTAGRNVHD